MRNIRGDCMYLSEIIIHNYGPIEDAKIKTNFISENNPCPIVLFGQNGSGKTLLLSNILQALIEIKRTKYNEIIEVSDNNFYRIGSLNYVKENSHTAYNRMVFTEDASFTEVMTKNYDIFKNNYSESDYPGINIEDTALKRDHFFSSTIPPERNVFEKEVFLFFPVERYYIPTWVNQDNDKLTYVSNKKRFVGKSSSSIVKYNVLESIEEWLLDVIIDKELYEKRIIDKNSKGEISIIYSGKNNNIQGTINKFLTLLYKNKGYDSARIAVSERKGLYRQIRIYGRKGEDEYELMPTITNLSSGEAMALGIMASILREADRVGIGNFDIKDIRGIVLIDEIDAHMHSDFIQEALPELISFYSGIQFIVSSHSPFFLLGMKNHFGDSCNFIELPFCENVDGLINFKEIRNCFEMVNRTYSDFLDNYVEIKKELANIKQPLIITEGKTDWKHLKHALSVFHDKGLFKSLNVKFLEYEETMGADNLEALIKKLAVVPNMAPIIGVFDNDSKAGKRYVKPKDFGNKVYACSITDVLGYSEEISIELLYSREDLTKMWPDRRRIFLSDEFTEKSHQLKEDLSVVSQNNTIADAVKRGIIKVVDSAVYNAEEKELAVSKEVFARQVYEGKAPYENISVDGFSKIFETIESILGKDTN